MIFYGDDPRALLAAADAEMRAGKPAEAAELLERYLLRIHPGPDDYLRLAAARRALGDTVAALDAVAAAVRLGPTHFLALLMGGSLLAAMGRTEEAARAYGAAIANAPPERMLPPALRAELDKARRQVEEQTAWRHSIEAARDDFDTADAAERGRLETFRANILRGRDAGSGGIEFDYPGLPYIEFFESADFAGVAALEAATATIRAEFEALVRVRAPELVSLIGHAGDLHVVDPNPSRRWSVINLFLNGVAVEENAALCPETIRLYRALQPPEVAGRSPNLMFSLLDPHTRIPPHKGVSNTRLVIHLPLLVPENCGFRVGATTRPWEVGRALTFDDTIEHEAWNDSGQLRVVLLGDLWRPELSLPERRGVAALMARSGEQISA